MDIKSAAKGTIFVFGLTFVGLGLNYIYGIFLARWYGVEEYGLYSIGLSVFNIVAVFSTMGLEHAVLRFVPRTEPEDFNNLYKIIFILGFLFSTMVSGLLYFFSDLIAVGFYNNLSIKVIIECFSLAVPAYVCSSIGLSFLQASHKVLHRMLVKYVCEPVLKLILTLAFVYYGYPIVGAIIAFNITIWISVVIVIIPHVIKILKRINIKKTNWSITRLIVKYITPVFIGSVFSISASKSDFILLGYLSTPAEVGLYAASFQTAAILAIALQSIESVLAPHLSEAINGDNKNKIREVYRLSLRWVLICGLPVFIVFILFSKEILGMYGEKFIEASLCFIVLSCGQIVNLSTGSANYMLLMFGKTKFVMINSIINGCLLIGFNLYLIPEYGIFGAALSMLLSTTLINLFRLTEVYYFFNIHPYSKDLLRPVIIAVIVYFSVYYLRPIVGSALYVIPITFISYLIIVLMFGLSLEDKKLFNSACLKLKIKPDNKAL